jgi:hypothetical protein
MSAGSLALLQRAVLPPEVVLAVEQLERMDQSGVLPAEGAGSIRALVGFVKAGREVATATSARNTDECAPWCTNRHAPAELAADGARICETFVAAGGVRVGLAAVDQGPVEICIIDRKGNGLDELAPADAEEIAAALVSAAAVAGGGGR